MLFVGQQAYKPFARMFLRLVLEEATMELISRGYIAGAAGILGVCLLGTGVSNATPTDLGGFTLSSGAVGGNSSGATGFGASGGSFNLTDGANQFNAFKSNDTISTDSNFSVGFNYNISANTSQADTSGAKTEFSLAGQNGTLNFVVNPFTNGVTDPPSYIKSPSTGGTGSGGTGSGGGAAFSLPPGNTGSSAGYYTFTNSFFYLGSIAGINLSYNRASDMLTETISFTGSGPVVFNYNINLSLEIGSQANLDFTSVTGTAPQTQNISGLHYSVATPEPTGLALLLGGGGVLLLLRRRRAIG